MTTWLAQEYNDVKYELATARELLKLTRLDQEEVENDIKNLRSQRVDLNAEVQNMQAEMSLRNRELLRINNNVESACERQQDVEQQIQEKEVQVKKLNTDIERLSTKIQNHEKELHQLAIDKRTIQQKKSEDEAEASVLLEKLQQREEETLQYEIQIEKKKKELDRRDALLRQREESSKQQMQTIEKREKNIQIYIHRLEKLAHELGRDDLKFNLDG